MTNATDKNLQALQALFGSRPLAHRLAETRIAVVTPAEPTPAAAAILVDFLVDNLARLWPNIDFAGDSATANLAVANAAAASGGGNSSGFAVRWAPPYTCVVAVGCDAPQGAAPTIRVGADGWSSTIGPTAACGQSANPAGPAFAAAIASAQVFLRVFAAELRDTGAEPLDDLEFDVRAIINLPNLEIEELDLGETHVFGVGAVTHGLAALLQRWPHKVTGVMHLVDRDPYGQSNGQRYSFMTAGDINQQKVDVVTRGLRLAHPHLVVHEHALDLNSYCSIRGYDTPLARCVVGLDSPEARRHAALKYPQNCVNMWTEGMRIGAGRFVPATGTACLACDYLEDLSKPYDEVSEIHRQTRLRPDLIRNLLDTGRGLDAQEAQAIATHWSISHADVLGQPLRSVLPILCATGKIPFPQASEAADVPFAFSSLMAGITGFMMLLRDITEPTAQSEGWTEHVFKRPTKHMYRRLHRQKGCAACDLALES